MKKNRSSLSGWWVVLLTSTLAVSVAAEAGVGLFNSELKQVVTSSTLKWASFKKESLDTYVVGAESEQGPIYLCRSRHEGDMILGQLKPDYTACAVSGVQSYTLFEVLENIENASLITWAPWGKFVARPNGGVVVDSSGGSVFIGRKKATSGYSHYVGRIVYESTTGQLIAIDDKNNAIIENHGEILIEIEPISYKLEDVVLELNTEHVRLKDTEIFEERILRNDDDVAASVIAEVQYQFNYTVSWGHGHGIAIGLNTTIEMADGTIFPSLQWANPYAETKTEFYQLERYLEPGTACNVTFRGNLTDRDVQYTAKLVTFYKDNNSRTRQMHGIRIENTLDVEALYGEIYFVGNNSLVPTTTTTSTTTTTTTTSTTIPPQVTMPPRSDNNGPAPIKKPDQSNEITSNELNESDENLSVPKEDIQEAVVGGLGSKPNGATIRIFTITLLIPTIAFIL